MQYAHIPLQKSADFPLGLILILPRGERIVFVEDLVTAPEVALAREPFNSLVPALAFKQITRLSNISFFIFSPFIIQVNEMYQSRNQPI